MSASKTPTTTTTTVSRPAGPAPPQPRGRYVHLSGTVILHTPHLAPRPAALVTSGTSSCRPCRGHRTKSRGCMVLVVVDLVVPFKSANRQRSSLTERAREVGEGRERDGGGGGGGTGGTSKGLGLPQTPSTGLRLVYDILPLEEGAGKRCSECGGYQ